MNTLSRIQHLIKLAIKNLWEQLWTKNDVPEENKLTHNFKDGKGRVSAIPYDNIGIKNDFSNITVQNELANNNDNVGINSDITKVELKTILADGCDNVGISNGFTEIKCVPAPIILEIQNEVQDKIEKIIPRKTQALPGQDFEFEIVFVKNYYYMEGDILPSYGVLSSDGKTLTVNSSSDLTIRLILAPNPQDWSKDRQDPSAKQEDTDVLLKAVPQDGCDTTYTLEKSSIEDWFHCIKFNNNCPTFLTSPTTYTPTILSTANTYDFNFKYNPGYDHNDIIIDISEPDVYYEYYSYDNKDYNIDQPIPSDYVKLAYIENTSDCYIDTGVKILSTDVVEAIANVKSSTSTSYKCLFGARQSSFVNNFFVFTRMNSQARACYARCNQEVWASSMTYDTDIKFIADSNSLKILNLDNEILHQIDVTGTACETTPVTCFIFDGNNNGNRDNSKCEGKIYSFKISDNDGNVKYHFIPAKRKSDLLIGLYEVIHGTFHTSKSSNTFGYQPVKIDDTRIKFKNITKDCTITINKSPKYDSPTNLIEENEIIYNYTLENSSIEDYFWVITETNNATDYMSVDATYKTPRCGADSSYVLTYKTGYDNNDISATTTEGMVAEIGESHYIAYNESEIPEGYSVIPGINNDSSNAYYKTGYIPQQGDTVICYAQVSSNYYTSPCYLFGARNSASNKSLVFYSRYNGDNNFAYERCSGAVQFSRAVDTLLKIECNDTGCITDYATGVRTINTSGTVVNSDYDIWLFDCNNANNVQGTTRGIIYKFTVKHADGTLAINLIPVKRDSDSALGFYDTVSGKFIGLSRGTVTIAAAPVYKSLVTLSNITKDSKITFSKNNDSRKSFEINDDSELEYTYSFEASSIEDYFWYVQQSNNVSHIATFDATYKTPRAYTDKPSNATYIVTYKNGCDNDQLYVEADNGAVATLNDTMHISYGIIPDEYDQVPGLINNDSSTYFRIYDPKEGSYKVKYSDRIECYANIYETRPSYPCYLFGAKQATGTNSMAFYGRNTANNNFAYERNSPETNMSCVYGQLLKINCDLYGVKYTNGYNTWEYKTDPKLYLEYDDSDYNPDVTLPNGYLKVSHINKKNLSKAFINACVKIKHDDKVELITNVSNKGTRSTNALYGSSIGNGITVAYNTNKTYPYPMTYDQANGYWKNTNQGYHSTNSELEFKMAVSGTLVLDVTQSSESGCDYLFILKNGSQVATTSGLSGARTITLTGLAINDVIRIYYRKDGSVNTGSDTATIKLKYNDIVLSSEFEAGSYTNTNTLYTATNGIISKKTATVGSSKFKFNDTVKIKTDETSVAWYNMKDELISSMTIPCEHEEIIYDTYILGINDTDTLVDPDGTCDICLYSFKIYDNADNLVKYFVPAVKSEDNSVGLYDIVSDMFYTSSNDDVFEYREIGDIHYYSDDCVNEMYLFGCNENGSRKYPIYGIIYKFTIYSEDNIPMVNLIPAKRKADGVLGFYDTVSDYFILPSAGKVTEAAIPSFLGGLYVTNITTDTKVTIKPAPKIEYDLIEDSIIDYDYKLLAGNIEDWFYVVKLVNNCPNAISFGNYAYGNMYTVRKNGNLNITPTYITGYDASNFTINTGTLTNTSWTVNNIANDMTITISLNDYHDPVINSDDDLGIFTDGLHDNINQYRVVNGDGTAIKSYTYISSEPGEISNKTIWAFSPEDINIIGFDPTDVPGEKVRATYVCNDDNMTEIIKSIKLGDYNVYEHTVTFKNQFRLEPNVQYMFKVRDKSDTGKLIAVSKDSNHANIICSDNEVTIEDNNYYFNWNEANKYIINGNYEIYFKINGNKI